MYRNTFQSILRNLYLCDNKQRNQGGRSPGGGGGKGGLGTSNDPPSSHCE